jgi:hypothetical protein
MAQLPYLPAKYYPEIVGKLQTSVLLPLQQVNQLPVEQRLSAIAYLLQGIDDYRCYYYSLAQRYIMPPPFAAAKTESILLGARRALERMSQEVRGAYWEELGRVHRRYYSPARL